MKKTILKIWILRSVLVLIALTLWGKADESVAWLYILLALVIAGFIFPFFKNPFEKGES